MLSELLQKSSIIHIAGREYQVRYSLNALLCLEMTFKPFTDVLAVDCKDWNIDTVLHLLRAAMCDLPENKPAVLLRDWDNIKPDLDDLGKIVRVQDLPRLRLEIAHAILESLPDNSGSANNNSSDHSAVDIGHFKALCVRIVGIPEPQFMDNSYYDNMKEADHFLEVKGLKEIPVQIQKYDKRE